MEDLNEQKMLVIYKYNLRNELAKISEDIKSAKEKISNSKSLEEVEAIRSYIELKMGVFNVEFKKIGIENQAKPKTI